MGSVISLLNNWGLFFTVNTQYGAKWNVIASLLLGLQFQVLFKVCAVETAMITVPFSYAKLRLARHFEASFHVGQTNWTPYR